ncbi:hypothetical protein ACWF94_06965 [Streptomyces sp. NPDC055078]
MTLLTAAVGGLLAGCTDAGGLSSAGPTRTATGPVRLWPDLPPVTAPPQDYGETETTPVPGIKVPRGGVRDLDPVAVLRAEAEADPGAYSGMGGSYRETADALRACRERPGPCPVLTPYHHDLTGDGQAELIVGVRLAEQRTAVRCYMPDGNGGLVRIMSTADQLVSVELAGQDIILRSVSAGIPGYEYRTAWSWDGRNRAMLPTRDEIVQVEPHRSAPERRSVPTAPGAAGRTGPPSRGATGPPGPTGSTGSTGPMDQR